MKSVFAEVYYWRCAAGGRCPPAEHAEECRQYRDLDYVDYASPAEPMAISMHLLDRGLTTSCGGSIDRDLYHEVRAHLGDEIERATGEHRINVALINTILPALGIRLPTHYEYYELWRSTVWDEFVRANIAAADQANDEAPYADERAEIDRLNSLAEEQP